MQALGSSAALPRKRCQFAMVALHRFFRHAVFATIEAYQAEVVRRGAMILPRPGKVTLTEAVDEQNRFAVGLSVFMDRQPETAAPGKGLCADVSLSNIPGCHRFTARGAVSFVSVPSCSRIFLDIDSPFIR